MIVLHHLEYSRSSRVIWLLEELDLEYELKTYRRDENFRSPAALKAVHPLGKAPVMEDGAVRIAESGPILEYIDAHHGGGRLSPPAGTPEAIVHHEWLHYVESSAALPMMFAMIGMMGGGLPDNIAAFADPELTKTLDYIRDGLGDGPFLMGKDLTIADIQLSYLLIALRSAGKLADYPELTAYLDRLAARPAFAKTIEIGGPLTPG